jgi:hypothetical protein
VRIRGSVPGRGIHEYVHMIEILMRPVFRSAKDEPYKKNENELEL